MTFSILGFDDKDLAREFWSSFPSSPLLCEFSTSWNWRSANSSGSGNSSFCNWFNITLDILSETWALGSDFFFFFILNFVWLVWSQCSFFRFFFFFFFGIGSVEVPIPSTAPWLWLTGATDISSWPSPTSKTAFSGFLKTSCTVSSSSPKSTVSEHRSEISEKTFSEDCAFISLPLAAMSIGVDWESSRSSKIVPTGETLSILDLNKPSAGELCFAFAAAAAVVKVEICFGGFFFEVFAAFFLLDGANSPESSPWRLLEPSAFLFCPTFTLIAAEFVSLCSMWVSRSSSDSKDKKAKPPRRSKSGCNSTLLETLAGDLPFLPTTGRKPNAAFVKLASKIWVAVPNVVAFGLDLLPIACDASGHR